MGICVHCLALGGVDLTSPAGKIAMGVIAAVAQFERDLLIERTLSGQARARAEGKRFGRKPVLDGEQRQKALQRLADGASISAGEMKASRATIMRVGRAGGGPIIGKASGLKMDHILYDNVRCRRQHRPLMEKLSPYSGCSARSRQQSD